jgi:hypothetical protein
MRSIGYGSHIHGTGRLLYYDPSHKSLVKKRLKFAKTTKIGSLKGIDVRVW